MRRAWKTTGYILCLLLLLLCSPLAARAAGPTVLFDQGHGQLFRVDQDGPLQLSALAELFRKAGWQVRVAGTPLSDESLAGVDALVSSGPFAPFAQAEVEAVGRYLERGGRFALMLHIAPPAASLLGRLGVSHANGVVRERQNVLHDQPLDFWVTRLEPHPLFSGVERFGLFGGWPLMNDSDSVRLIAFTSPQAWVDLDRNGQPDASDPAQSFAVAAAGTLGRGRFVVFGDDAIFQNRYLEEYNGALGRSLVRWLGEK